MAALSKAWRRRPRPAAERWSSNAVTPSESVRCCSIKRPRRQRRCSAICEDLLGFTLFFFIFLYFPYFFPIKKNRLKKTRLKNPIKKNQFFKNRFFKKPVFDKQKVRGNAVLTQNFDMFAFGLFFSIIFAMFA